MSSLLQNFTLVVTSDFADIDYPVEAMSPSHRQQTADGWRLTWSFKRILTGQTMGLAMPSTTSRSCRRW